MYKDNYEIHVDLHKKVQCVCVVEVPMKVLFSRVFANGLGNQVSIPGRVIPKT